MRSFSFGVVAITLGCFALRHSPFAKSYFDKLLLVHVATTDLLNGASYEQIEPPNIHHRRDGHSDEADDALEGRVSAARQYEELIVYVCHPRHDDYAARGE
jgi:hypothetical protein